MSQARWVLVFLGAWSLTGCGSSYEVGDPNDTGPEVPADSGGYDLLDAATLPPGDDAGPSVDDADVPSVRVDAAIPNDEPEVIAWLLPPKEAPRTSARWFVAQVSGASMEPKIPNGSLCLFRPVAGNDYVDRVLLVQHRGVADLDTGGSFAVKRIARVSRNKSGTTVVLESVNQRFKPIVIESRTDDELRPIAELDRVLWSPATAG